MSPLHVVLLLSFAFLSFGGAGYLYGSYRHFKCLDGSFSRMGESHADAWNTVQEESVRAFPVHYWVLRKTSK